jgi:hypothetical protein
MKFVKLKKKLRIENIYFCTFPRKVKHFYEFYLETLACIPILQKMCIPFAEPERDIPFSPTLSQI